jgi:purine-binding chemotaxis protein CheW
MSFPDGPFPWANFGEPEKSPNPNTDLPLLPDPVLPEPVLPPLQLMEPMIELDLTADEGVSNQSDTETDSNDFSVDFSYRAPNSKLDPIMESVLDSVIESVETMDKDLVTVPDVMPSTDGQEWVTELPSLNFESSPEVPVVRLEDVVAQIDAEVAASADVEVAPSVEIERRTIKSQTEKHITFSLAGAKYAMPLGQVIEISRAPKLMPLPNVPDWLLGVTNLRGDIISVVDLHTFLGLPVDAHRDSSRMCVVRAERQEMITGLMVDRVEGLASLAGESFGWPAAGLEGNISQYLQGVGEHGEQLLRVLNLDSLLQAFDLGG